MIDLEVYIEKEKVVLNRDVRTGEEITYQNDYLREENMIRKAKVHKDLKVSDELVSGYYEKGKTVITADLGTEDFLIVKKIK